MEKLSRREFVKITGAIAGAVVLESCGVQVKPTPTPEVPPIPDKNPPATQEQIDYIKDHGLDPYEMILSKLNGETRLVGLGETHRQLNEELFAADIIDKAVKEKRIQFLALEIIDEHQDGMDAFLADGTIDEALQQDLDTHKEGYLKILTLARAQNLAVICADSRSTPDRDTFMDERIVAYMNEHKKEKGIFYAGIAHIVERKHIIARVLGDAYYSVTQIDNDDKKDTFFDAMKKSGMRKIVGIDHIGQTPFRYTPYGYFAADRTIYTFAFDAVVLHPATP